MCSWWLLNELPIVFSVSWRNSYVFYCDVDDVSMILLLVTFLSCFSLLNMCTYDLVPDVFVVLQFVSNWHECVLDDSYMSCPIVLFSELKDFLRVYCDFDDFQLILWLLSHFVDFVNILYVCLCFGCFVCSSLFWLIFICSWWLLNELSDCFV